MSEQSKRGLTRFKAKDLLLCHRSIERRVPTYTPPLQINLLQHTFKGLGPKFTAYSTREKANGSPKHTEISIDLSLSLAHKHTASSDLATDATKTKEGEGRVRLATRYKQRIIVLRVILQTILLFLYTR